MARNARLHTIAEHWERELEQRFADTRNKQRLIREFGYAARLEFAAQGTKRFVITNLDMPAEALYD